MNKKSSDLLKLGIGLLIAGVLLAYYSFVSFIDFRTLGSNIDFESVENNIQMSDTDKYYKYLTFADYLNKKIDKNKNLIIKNESCAYIDYAHHNAIAIYDLAQKKMTEPSKKDASVGIVEELYDKLDYYSTCKNYKTYKEELHKILEGEEKRNDLYQTQRMKMFLKDKPEEDLSDSGPDIEKVSDIQTYENSDLGPSQNEPAQNEKKPSDLNQKSGSETNIETPSHYPDIRY